MSESLIATKQDISATVSASAGTGKTWLLVTRLIRLLLSGSRPDGILAVTFTRKAAAEMQTRLNERLLELAHCSEDELSDLLTKIDATNDESTRQKARTLYETLLSSPHSIRTSTFHSFCQEILRRFPLEAGIAPGFELQESTENIRKEAWSAVIAKVSTDPECETAKALETLIDVCDGLTNVTTAINSFLDHRSDWWAFTEGQEDPLSFAIDTLINQLNINPDEDPEEAFFNTSNVEILGEFITLLEKHPGKKNNEARDSLLIARDSSYSNHERFKETFKAFFTTTGTPRVREEKKIQAQKMGEEGQQRFLEIHNLICERISDTLDKINTRDAFIRMGAWYRAGCEVLDNYQQLKNELRALDFSDLEWLSYLLLNHSNNVHWIQYKLDQRIDHLLIDEFQDTNPTQWQLIFPLLQELAAGENERHRTVFLVGDNKQSIYRFRRAEPELFNTAQAWLKDNLKAISHPLNVSWRSSDAIMNFVNHVFGSGVLNQQIIEFTHHTTHHPDLWGRVEFLPLIESQLKEETESVDFRNPLHEPRRIAVDERHLQEGRLIASQITNLIKNKTLIGPVDKARPINYSDIIILVRKRTHVGDYEQALREAGIPYAGTDRGTLLNRLEIRDLVYLLELLITPFNNLAFASILRSPLFDCSNEDLIALAKIKEGNWLDRLSLLSSGNISGNEAVSENLLRANNLLTRWQKLVGTLPVHDLLDRIFCEGDVLNRYRSGNPPHLHNSVAANLTRFLELALEIDSGRNPTVGRFLSRLQSLRQQSREAPDEGSPIDSGHRVRILTIHASKGLEAPVVFLADTTFSDRDKNYYQTVVDWPANNNRPTCFLLTGKKNSRDNFTDRILQQHALAEMRENANLLYVAITRAKQLLYISGCQPNKGNELGWYGLMQEQCREKETDALINFESGTYPEKPQEETHDKSTVANISPLLRTPLESRKKEFVIAPSHLTGTLNQIYHDDQETSHEFLIEDARVRGIAIHRCLQLLSDENYESGEKQSLSKLLSSELGLLENDVDLKQWIDEAEAVYRHADFSRLFDKNKYQAAYNEVPIQYYDNEQVVYGIIDRLVVTESEIWVIDYKTHRFAEKGAISAAKEYYLPQIEYYCIGANKLWPGKKTRGFLLFTHQRELLDMEISLQ